MVKSQPLMSKQLLIDAMHPEEIRVAIVKENILEDFDSELSHKSSIKSNIYLAKVMRVEPALQAAFLDFGNERQGFLPLSEIHPDYYQNEDLVIVGESEEVISRKRQRIQDVIVRKQILPVQILKEPRAQKGAYLTTYLSILGRYCILMPNSGHRPGGVSRRIDQEDRKRLKLILGELGLPEGMSLILRTAVQDCTKIEIKRDLDYLMRVWREIYNGTHTGDAPKLLYLEGNLIRKSLRDLYKKDINEIFISGAHAYKEARVFMKKLMPSQVTRIQQYKDPHASLFQKYNVEMQIETIFQPIVNLPSGGSLVISPTEALIAIDINSGKSIKESTIEETAFHTNLEAAHEIARQLRLRDLGGIIVIDFIDMSLPEHIEQIEKCFKEAIKPDRARIQLGKISTFGLLEVSRQRIRPSLIDNHTSPCTHCYGTGIVRSIESFSLLVLRQIEAKLQENAKNITVFVPQDVDLFLLNQNRQAIIKMEKIYAISVFIFKKNELSIPHFDIVYT